MLISLHKQATTTPKIRAAIQASSEPAWLVAERYGISEQTVWKWRSRDDVHDRRADRGPEAARDRRGPGGAAMSAVWVASAVLAWVVIALLVAENE